MMVLFSIFLSKNSEGRETLGPTALKLPIKKPWDLWRCPRFKSFYFILVYPGRLASWLELSHHQLPSEFLIVFLILRFIETYLSDRDK